MMGGTGRQLGRFVVTVAAAALAVALAAPATAGATTGRPRELPPAIYLDSGGMKLVAAGHSWAFTVYGQQNPSFLVLGLERGGQFGSESHQWSFNKKAGSLTKLKPGVWRLTSSSADAPVATVDLTFTASKHRAVSCYTGSEMIYTGSLSGTAWLHTGYKSAGTVGGKSLKFPAPNQVVVDSGCAQKRKPQPCMASVSGNAIPTSSSALISGGDGSAAGSEIFVDRFTPLSKPTGATRDDFANADGAPTSFKHGQLTFTPRAGSIIAGAVTFTPSGKKFTFKLACLQGGTKHTESDISWAGGSASSTLAAHFVLGGTRRPPATAPALVSETVVS